VCKLELINNEPMATSRDIANKLNKEHSKVMAKIRSIFTVAEYGEREYSYGNNNKASEYLLNKDSFILLVMNYEGFNDFKRAYIKQFNAMLEELSRPQLPQSFSEALQLAADQAKQLELQAPKVELADKCIRNKKEMSITDAGKHLNIGQKKIFEIMRSNSYLTIKRLPTQKALDRKVLTLKTNPEQGFQQAVMTMENIMNFQKRHAGKTI